MIIIVIHMGCVTALRLTHKYTHLPAPNNLTFQYQMEQKVQLKYVNKFFQIGLVNWREAYLLFPSPEQLLIEVYRGNIVYRKKGSPKQIYYNKLKAGLTETEEILKILVPKH